MEHPGSDQNPGFLLWQVSTLWSQSTSAALKPLGLTHPQFIILATIDWLAGKSASQAEIGQRTVLDPKVTSHLLRSLQVKGLIEKLNVEDEKIKHPKLTAAGMEMLKKAFPLVEKADSAFFSAIDLKNISMVTSLQTLGAANFSKIEPEQCNLSE